MLARVKWTDVVTALRDGSGVCCFTAATSNDNNFDITHVAVPLSSEPYRGGKKVYECQNINNYGVVCNDIDVAKTAIDMQGCTHVTLDEAECLIAVLCTGCG